MKDTNQMIRYQGFQRTSDGGRELQFSLDESKESVAAVVTISIEGSFFTRPGGITFQEAAAICCGKLRQERSTGTHYSPDEHFALTYEDVTQFRELPRGRRRA